MVLRGVSQSAEEGVRQDEARHRVAQAQSVKQVSIVILYSCLFGNEAWLFSCFLS